MNGPGVKSPIKENATFGLACVLVVGVLSLAAIPGYLEYEAPNPDDAYYNLLVQGFRAGQLNVKREPHPGLARLPNPYDPATNAPYVWDPPHLAYDMSYFKGKLYLYFGITPAAVLFWPYNLVTGHYISHKNACVIFSVMGFVAGAGVIFGIWRRYFPKTGPWVAAAGAVAFGLGSGLLEILSSCDVWEVAVTCGFAFTMAALAAIWQALHTRHRKIQWLALAGLAYGMAVGSRPSLLFGAIILLLPIAAMVHSESGRVSLWRGSLLSAAAIVPLALVGLGLMVYNFLRFDSPFEFGWHYQLTGFDNHSARQFSLQYASVNFHYYFLEPMGWSRRFPFLRAFGMSALPSGHAGVVGTQYGGILRDSPFAWLALAAPLAWRGRFGEETAALRWFAAALFLLFVSCAITLCLFVTASSRYEVDYLPALSLLAGMGVFGLERQAAQSALWRPVTRVIWSLALIYSLVFNGLAAFDSHAATHYFVGNFFFHHGRMDKAIEYFDKASTLESNSAGYHFSLANALSQAGRTDESIVQFRKALELEPDSAEANNNLAFTLLQAGRVDEAIKHFQRALELQKNYQAFYNLAYAFRMEKMATEAETNWQKAIEIEPQFVPAQRDLSWMLATWPDAAARDGLRALALAENLDRHVPNNPEILRTLAAAYAETGHFAEAVTTAKRALAIAQTQSKATLAKQLQSEIALYQSNTPCRSFNN